MQSNRTSVSLSAWRKAGLWFAVAAHLSLRAGVARSEPRAPSPPAAPAAEGAKTDVGIHAYAGLLRSSRGQGRTDLAAGARGTLGYGLLEAAGSLEAGLVLPDTAYRQIAVEAGPRFRNDDYHLALTGLFGWRWYSWGVHGYNDDDYPLSFSTPTLGGRLHASLLSGSFEFGGWLLVQTDLRREEAPATSNGRALNPTTMGQSSWGGGLMMGGLY